MAGSPASGTERIRFGIYTVDVRAGEITKHGTRIRLQDRPLQILLILLSRAGEVVTREELRQKLWPEGTFVDFDRGISSAINKLRTALGDTAADPKFVETVGRKGYRFIYPLTEFGAGEDASAPETAPSTPTRASRKKWLLMAIGVLAILSTAATAIYLGQRTPITRVRSIAVLPLRNLSNTPDEEFFSEGLTEELITKLASLPGLQVISSGSTMRYKATQKSAQEIAKELRVDGIVQGSVLRVGDKVRITVQLVQADTDRYLWASSYEREQSDILDLQNQVTREIAENIRLRLDPDERERLRSAKLVDPEAYNDYLRGLSYWKRRRLEDLQTAAEYFQRAIQRDPQYAQAYAGVADCYVLIASYSYYPPQDDIAKAREAALKALQLNDRLAEAHTSLALIYENYDWNWAAAEEEYKKAIALDPNYATAHHWYGEFLGYMGRFDESKAEYARALRLDPFSLIIQADYAVSLYYAKQYDASIAEFEAVKNVDPNFPRAHVVADVYLQQGHFNKALAEALTDVPGDHPWQLGRLINIYAHMGKRSKAQELMKQLQADYRKQELNPSPLIIASIALGENDKAISWLERAYQEHVTIITWLKVEPIFDPLRKDPRFQSLLKKVELDQ